MLVEDERVWRVDFVYRDFRRGHPLGLVAHARSTLEMRPVPIPEAFLHLEAWALEIVRLPLGDLAAFRQGGPLRTPTFAVGAAADAKEDLRVARAKDLVFYQETLLGVARAERTRMKKSPPDPALSFAAAIAAARGTTEAALLEDLRGRLAKERERLGDLARLLPSGSNEPPGPGQSIDALLLRLEEFRNRFEDAAADALFEKAAGFPPGRISTASLSRGFDLFWIAGILRWDGKRLQDWTRARRAAFEADLEEIALPRILARAGLERDPLEAAPKLLDGLAALFGATGFDTTGGPLAWRDLDDVQVLASLSSLFRLEDPPSLEGPNPSGLPFLDEDLRASADAIEDPWLLLGTVAEMAGASLGGPERSSARDWAARWHAIVAKDRRLEGDEARAAMRAILAALEARFTGACDVAIEACLAEGARESSRAGPLRLSEEGVDRAEQEERFLLKDISSRAARISNDADYALVHLLERDADLYRGFEVSPATRRKIQVRDAEGVPMAQGLIGGVRGPTLREVIDEERKRAGPEEDGEDAGASPAAILRRDERIGTSGIEAMFDAELRGRDGHVEATSLEEFGSDGLYEAAVNGGDVLLTLDRDLQLAAEETLEHPVAPRNGKPTDDVWFENPVGAIVLLSPDGEVLAAASAPRRSGHPAAPGRDLERTFARERTLTLPVFNPPGSSIKPFVAAYAVDKLGLDPNEEFGCGLIDDGGFGYQNRSGTMHCHVGGHGRCNLEKALAVSCNATFAQIGERFRPEDLLDMARTFGFGLPTGIRRYAPDGDAPRSGLLEQPRGIPDSKVKELDRGHARMQFANGLAVVEATPMQVARAMAGLVTGRLPDVRLVRSVAGRDAEARSTELPISKHVRERILRDLGGVVRPGGTAYETGLDVQTLGFSFACKTGTADTRHIEGASRERKDGQIKMRKQTWIVGWFPEEDPKAILVVLIHDVIESSTHSSAIVASQFLRSPAVRRFAGCDAPEPGGTEAGPR